MFIFSPTKSEKYIPASRIYEEIIVFVEEDAPSPLKCVVMG